MNPIIQIKVTIEDIKPLIWRRLLVKSSSTFFELHNILQITFGWENSHIFQFKVEDYFIGIPDPDNIEVIDANDLTLGNILTEKDYEVTYEYDFGDSWEHIIKVEKFLYADLDSEYPVYSAGKMAAPPENCGGVTGYYQIMKARGNKKHPEYEQLKGGRKSFNPGYFNIESVNNQLARLKSYIKKIENN